MRAVEPPLPERTAMVNADAVESVDDAFEVADGVWLLSHQDFHHFAGRQIRDAARFHQRHIIQ
jgi:hypothetical protein